MRVRGKVVSVDTKKGYSVVESERTSACEGCHKSAEGCSVCTLMGSGKRKISTIAVNDVGAEIGDTVEIETETARVLGYAFLVFILPIVLMLIAALTSEQLGLGSKMTYILIAVGFVLGMAVAYIYSRFVTSKRADARIVSIIDNEGGEPERSDE